MSGPSISLQLIDPGASGRPVNTDQIPVYVGIAAQGSTTEVKTSTRPSQLVTEYLRGHLVDAASHHLAVGNREVKTLRVAATTPGAVDIDDSGPGFLSSVTGTPTQFLSVVIEVVTSALVSSGNCAVRYSLDHWTIPGIEPTWSPTTKIPSNGQLPLSDTGLIAVFDTGDTPTVGDDVTFTTTPGEYNSGSVASAADVIRLPSAGDSTYWVFCGETALASSANTLATAIEGEILESFNAARFHGALVGGGLGSDSSLVTAIASQAIDPPFLSMGYGAAYVTNPVNAIGRGRLGLREHEVAAARIGLLLISTDPGRTASGELERVVGTDYDAAVEGDTLHDARVAVLKTWEPASEGFFIQRQRLLSSNVSNFISWQHAAIMIAALRAAHRVAFALVLEHFRTTEGNTLDPREAADIQSAVNAELERVLITPLNVRGMSGHVSAVGSTVSLSTELPAIDIEIRIRPLGYGEDLTFTLQYANEV